MLYFPSLDPPSLVLGIVVVANTSDDGFPHPFYI